MGKGGEDLPVAAGEWNCAKLLQGAEVGNPVRRRERECGQCTMAFNIIFGYLCLNKWNEGKCSIYHPCKPVNSKSAIHTH